MWWLIKTSFYLAVLGALAYGVFYVPVAGKTLAEHGREVWHSDVIQKKVELVREDVEGELAARLEKKGKAAAARAVKTHEEISDGDKKALDDLLVKAMK